MAIANSGAVKFSDLAAEFGGTAPHSFSEFYRNTDNTGAVPHSFGADVEEVYTVELNSSMNSGGTQTVGTTTPSLQSTGRVQLYAGNYYNFRVYANQSQNMKAWVNYNGGSSNATAFGWFESPGKNSTGSTSSRNGITIGHSHSSWALKYQRAGSNWCDANQSDCHWSNVGAGHYFSVQGYANLNMRLRFKGGSRGSDSGSGSKNRNFSTGAGCSINNRGGSTTIAGTVASYSFNLGGNLGTVSGNFNQNNNANNSAETIRTAINAIGGNVSCTRSGSTLTINTGRFTTNAHTFGLTQNDGSNCTIASQSSVDGDSLEIANGTVPTSGAIKINNFRGARKTR